MNTPLSKTKLFLLISGITLSLGSLIFASGVNSRPTQACIDLSSGRFEATPDTGKVEFLVTGCDGELHRWTARPEQQKSQQSL